MYVAEVTFRFKPGCKHEHIREEIGYLAAAWYKNGQNLSYDRAVIEGRRDFTAVLQIPERNALNGQNNNRWARHWIRELRQAGATGPHIRIRGRDPELLPACKCRRRSSYVLFTTFAHLESPLRCGDCFNALPLYRLRPWRNDEFADALDWAGAYRRCDWLYMGSATGEKFALRELSHVASSLTHAGRELCRQFEKHARKPVYYYLYRAYARSVNQEEARTCPGCGKAWRLSTTWLKFFDFRCERCRLASNLAWNVR